MTPELLLLYKTRSKHKTTVNKQSPPYGRSYKFPLKCNYCGNCIITFPFYRKYCNRKTKYYHIECAKKVNLL